MKMCLALLSQNWIRATRMQSPNLYSRQQLLQHLNLAASSRFTLPKRAAYLMTFRCQPSMVIWLRNIKLEFSPHLLSSNLRSHTYSCERENKRDYWYISGVYETETTLKSNLMTKRRGLKN